ncbi:nitrilase-related carbon-nitrogen hydrolase [Aquimarina sp. RZ0]|uniref:nitrilase-related carbon-nitrogen hydrolase n=1 Tax=Aquimarina sp. RZ0 TaxID=2607730 RepID=UPI0011F20542|nr:nitrilase-related carbon-nitrogen hydrolase [Aquimarina sp. RZ0]KAA1244952.1 nitrilase [Aquimarina sp. RZ0]
MIKQYKALALQTECLAINSCKDSITSRQHMQKSLQKVLSQVSASKRFIGPDLKLVVFPEYFLTSFPFGESISQWQEKACISIDDDLFSQMKAFCVKEAIFLSGNFYEIDPHFPDLYFQSSFIIDDQGELILRYRRLNSMFAPTPHDVLDEYINIYGEDSLFPVVDTKLGKLACIASEEILYPEIARCLMMRGAEVFLHSSSEVGSPQLTHKEIAKRARAIENMAYLVSANSAGIQGIDIPHSSTNGASKIVHYEGHILSEAAVGESMVANSYLDLLALRDYRSKVSMQNYNARQRFELYAPSYASYTHYPPNTFKNVSPSKDLFIKTQIQVIKNLFN